MSSAIIRDRIVALRRVRAGELLPDKRNWRRHPKAQREALRGMLSEIGYADALLVRETVEGKLILIDGHLRAALDPNQVVPVLVLDLDEIEAGKLLATLDPLAAMAQPDMDALMALLADTSFQSAAVNEMLEALANGETQPLPDMPVLPDREKSLLGQMTFTVTDDQRAQINRALSVAKRANRQPVVENENSNGNGLAFIAEVYLMEHGE